MNAAQRRKTDRAARRLLGRRVLFWAYLPRRVVSGTVRALLLGRAVVMVAQDARSYAVARPLSSIRRVLTDPAEVA